MQTMKTAWQLQQAIFALRTGAYRIAEDDPETEISIVDDLPEEAAAVRAAILSVGRQARETAELAKMARKMAQETTERAQRFERRSDQMRQLLLAAMDALGDRKIEGPDVTIGLRAGVPSVAVTDEAKIPDQYWKITRSLDKAAIRDDLKQGVVIDGAALSNGLPSVSIRGN